MTGSQTVREALLFYATLRLPTLEKSELEERVDKVIEELGLTKVRDSLIGYVGADATNSYLLRRFPYLTFSALSQWSSSRPFWRRTQAFIDWTTAYH